MCSWLIVDCGDYDDAVLLFVLAFSESQLTDDVEKIQTFLQETQTETNVCDSMEHWEYWYNVLITGMWLQYMFNGW